MSAERQQFGDTSEPLILDPSKVGEYFMNMIQKMEIAGEVCDDDFYRQMQEGLRSKIVGQDEAIEAITDELGYEDLESSGGPISTLMFLGPSGVGKSQTAKEVARLLHNGSDRAFLNINCSQFKSYGDVTVLQGSPLGYIGSDQDPLLREDIVSQPKNVLLFDEIEKAHPAIHDFLMEAVDEGEILLLNKAKKLSLANSILIFTSNAGTEEINNEKNKKSLGFHSSESDDSPEISRGKLEEITQEALKKIFRPEFLGRIGNKILFNYLSDDQLSLALKGHFEEFRSMDVFAKRSVFVDISPELRDDIVKRTPTRIDGGFREVRHTFRRTVGNELRRRVVSGNIPPNSYVYAVPASEESKAKDPQKIANFLHQSFSA